MIGDCEINECRLDLQHGSHGHFNSKLEILQCALTIPNDGTQDNNIHCFKTDQPRHAGLEKLQSLTDIVTALRADQFPGISVAANLDDEAEMESDPVKVISDDSGSNVEHIDIEH